MQMPRMLLALCLLLSASIASAQENLSLGETVSASYKNNRAAFHQQRNSRANEVHRLDKEITAQRELLNALSRERETLQQLPVKQQGKLEQLRSLSGFLESRVFGVLHPMSALGNHSESAAKSLLGPAETSDARHLNDRGQSGLLAYLANVVSSIIPGQQNSHNFTSFLLPVFIILGVLSIRKRHRDFYDKHKQVLQRGALVLVVLFPLSSFAQPNPAIPKSDAQIGRASEELATLFGKADAVLGLSLVQRYINELSAGKSAGRRIRITGIELPDSPLTLFKSVVVGSGEYYSTLAALHNADKNTAAAFQALEPLALAETRFASQNKDPQSYETLLVKAFRYLVDRQQTELGEQILSQHGRYFRDRAIPQSLAAELHNDTTPDSPYDYVFDNSVGAVEDVDAAPVALALGSLDALLRLGPPGAGEAVSTAGNQGVLQGAQNAVANASRYLGDLAQLFSRIDQLGEEGRSEEAPSLLEEAIDVTSKAAASQVDGQMLPSTQALQYLSYESFRRGYFSFAEKSVMAAIKPLSVAERRALEMRVPPGAVAQLRVPEPEHLVAPLYLGLLYEKQGRNDDARSRFESEGRRAVESLVQSNGLYIPDMMNHLSLLGSVVDPQAESATLEQIDKLLSRLEQEALDELAASTELAIEQRRAELREVQTETGQLQTEIAELRLQIAASDRSALATAVSAFLLLLRSLGLIAVVVFLVTMVFKVALSHAQNRGQYRLSAFWWKLVETLGWVWLLSLLSAPLGLVMVVAAQYFLLNHLRFEAKSSRSDTDMTGRKQFSSSPAAEGKDAGAATDSRNAPDANESGDGGGEKDQWTNVIQMLRDSKDSDTA